MLQLGAMQQAAGSSSSDVVTNFAKIPGLRFCRLCGPPFVSSLSAGRAEVDYTIGMSVTALQSRATTPSQSIAYFPAAGG
jgi:hypothetical protein